MCFVAFSVQVPQAAERFDGPVFFGGVSDQKQSQATGTNFIGCIGDATLNGKIVNFVESQSELNAIFQQCPLQKSISIFNGSSVGKKKWENTWPDLICSLMCFFYIS